MRKKVKSGFFILILLLVLYLAARVIWPYLSYVVLAFLIAYALRPFYSLIHRYVHQDWLSAMIMVLLILSLIIIPTSLVIQTIAVESTDAIVELQETDFTESSLALSELLGTSIDINESISIGLNKLQQFLVNQSPDILSDVVDIILGLVVMFFILFYAFKDGDKIYALIRDVLPLQKSHKQVLFDEVHLVTNAVIYGQIITAVVQGTVAGIGYVIFGLPNPVFWAFITGLMSFLPVVGTPVAFIPLAFYQFISGNYGSGVGILIYGLVLVMNIDNVIKPLIISEKSQLNSALILVGVIGGIKAFGFMGFFLGPMILGLLIVFIKVFQQDFKPSEELEIARKTRQREEEMIVHLFKRPDDEHRKND